MKSLMFNTFFLNLKIIFRGTQTINNRFNNLFKYREHLIVIKNKNEIHSRVQLKFSISNVHLYIIHKKLKVIF